MSLYLIPVSSTWNFHSKVYPHLPMHLYSPPRHGFESLSAKIVGHGNEPGIWFCCSFGRLVFILRSLPYAKFKPLSLFLNSYLVSLLCLCQISPSIHVSYQVIATYTFKDNFSLLKKVVASGSLPMIQRMVLHHAHLGSSTGTQWVVERKKT